MVFVQSVPQTGTRHSDSHLRATSL